MSKIKKFIKNFYFKEQDGRRYFRRIHIVSACTLNGTLIASGSLAFGLLSLIFTAIMVVLSYENDTTYMKLAKMDKEVNDMLRAEVQTLLDEKQKLIKEAYANKKEV